VVKIANNLFVWSKVMGRPADSAINVESIDLHWQTRFALLALTGLISTILLIMLGSFVRVSGNGLGCPDWPLCYGRAVPPFEYSAWVEFSHRLFGGVVGLQVGGLSLLGLRKHDNGKNYRLPSILLGTLLIVQVSLGGLHVLNELPGWTGLIHTGIAMAIVGLLAYFVAVTQPKLKELGNLSELINSRAPTTAAIVAAGTYILILTGSLVTRTGSSLACPSFPLCGVSPVPDYLQSYVIIQMIHRLSAFIVAGGLLGIVWFLLKKSDWHRTATFLAIVLGTLVLAQFALGIGNVLLAIPMWTRILHLGTAASIWALAVIVFFSLGKARR
jgi:heme A synthase